MHSSTTTGLQEVCLNQYATTVTQRVESSRHCKQTVLPKPLKLFVVKIVAPLVLSKMAKQN
jgi:hypothetical protein